MIIKKFGVMLPYSEIIHKYGLRDTSKRKKVYETLSKSKYPLSAIEIHERLNNVDLATIHRALNTFVKLDLIEWNNFLNEGKKYSLKTKRHNHIISCKRCGKKAIFDVCFIKSFERDIKEKTGFEVLEHQLQFIGLCTSCRSK